MLSQNVSLKDFSNFKTGGKADYFLEINDIASLEEELRNIASVPVFILGKGTNILISDIGFKGLIVHNLISGINHDGELVEVGSGILMSDLLNYCINNSLSGLEWAGGLPGTVGGAVRGNAGAFSGEIKDQVDTVESISLEDFNIKKRSNKDCGFKYRDSVFKSGEGKKEIITKVYLRLKKGKKEKIQELIGEKVQYREKRHPLEFPNLGSTFKNVPYDSLNENQKEVFKDCIKIDPFPIVPAGRILSMTGMKKVRVGGAMFSEKHANFIVNLGDAKSEDVEKLIKLAKEKVFEKFGVKIEEEIMYLGGDKNGR